MIPLIDDAGHHRAARAVKVFNALFSDSYQTRLEGGVPEPLYQAMSAGNTRHRIKFTRDYFASALHEVAHWCIAGAGRRALDDYGYWYAPDGRTAAQQQLFEEVEVKPQALEWVFSRASGFRFRLSADNLAGGLSHSETFRAAVWRQAQAFCEQGLPDRAATFAAGLAQEFGIDSYLDPTRYRLEDI